MNTTKYDFRDGKIICLATLKPIPADEPVVVLRAQDRHAVRGLNVYVAGLNEGPHKTAMQDILNQFFDFGARHPEAIKEPDTGVPGADVEHATFLNSDDQNDQDGIHVPLVKSTGSIYFNLNQAGWIFAYEQEADKKILYAGLSSAVDLEGKHTQAETCRDAPEAIAAAADKLIRAAGAVQQKLNALPATK